jgi:hypothetical protein
MKRLFGSFCVLALLVAAVSRGGAQVAPSAYARQFSLTAGGLASAFQPDYGPTYLYGVGAYIDVKFTRWAQVEAEGRWLRFNQYANIYEDNYLIGPRVPIRRIWKANTYAKVLGGYGIMNFEYNFAHGRFYNIAFGGGADIKLTKRISWRAIDAEYQVWPDWVQGSLKPYGLSTGVSYRVFGGR